MSKKQSEEDTEDTKEKTFDPTTLAHQISVDYRTSPDEVIAYMQGLWRSAQKAELVEANTRLFFRCKELSDRLRALEQMVSQMDLQTKEGEKVNGSALVSLLTRLGYQTPYPMQQPIMQPVQQKQDDDMKSMMKDLLPIILLTNAMGGKKDEKGIDIVELVKTVKELAKPERQMVKMQTEDGQIMEVPLEVALMMQSRQQALGPDQIKELLSSIQQPVSKDELKRQVQEEFKRDKEFWQEYFQATGGTPPEVLIEKEKQETERKRIETEASLEKEKLKTKQAEIEAQRRLIDAIINPEGEKKTTKDIGADVAGTFF